MMSSRTDRRKQIFLKESAVIHFFTTKVNFLLDCIAATAVFVIESAPSQLYPSVDTRLPEEYCRAFWGKGIRTVMPLAVFQL